MLAAASPTWSTTPPHALRPLPTTPQALERTEAFFWRFCDDYLELVKNRAYDDGDGRAAVREGRARHRARDPAALLAPFLPFVTEEVWSWWQEGSVHRTARLAQRRSCAPSPAAADPAVFDVAAEVLSAVRKAKTSEQRSLRTHVLQLVIADTAERLGALRQAEGDVRGAGNVDELILNEGAELQVTASSSSPEPEAA